MNLREKLNEFNFNLETAMLLQSLGRSREQISNEMNSLHFSDTLLNFYNDTRHLYNSVMLRLQLYAESNLPEDQVRQSLSVLNNSNISHLLDYLYNTPSSKVNTQPVVQETKAPVVQETKAPVVQETKAPVVQETKAPVVQETKAPVVQETNDDDDDTNSEVSEDDQNPFESFFGSCVEQTDEPTDIVKASDFYDAFSEWWKDQYEDEIPDKKELKNFLNERLGKSKKSTWTNVVLTN